MDTDHEELNELVQAHLDGRATEEQAFRLNATLKMNKTARDLYLQIADTHSCLAVDEGLWVDQVNDSISSSVQLLPANQPWFAKRSLASIAAGVVFGMLCGSMVFAYGMPRMKLKRQRVIQVFKESFEDEKVKFNRGFPSDAGGWSGDFEAVVRDESGKSPKDGQYMARLASAANRKFCALARIVDLTEFPQISSTETRTVEVTASFHGMGTEWADRNQIRLAAFSEAPRDVKAIWNADNRLEQALLHLGRTVKMKPGEHGWQTLKVSMEIPTGARSLVIHLGAGTADDAGPKTNHYLDAIHVQFVIKEGSQ
jgi:hypothetical protein